MSDTDVQQAQQLASGNVAALLPEEGRTIEQERLHRKQNLAAAFRLFSRFGFDEGVAGHITARDPELTDHFWVNPFGMHFGHIRRQRPAAGAPRRRDRPGRPASESGRVRDPFAGARGPAGRDQRRPRSFRLRQDMVDARPAARPDHPGRCAFYDDHALFDDYSGVVLDIEEGKRIAHALGDRKAVILRNHGLLTVGHSVEEAAWWFITMERSCHAQLMAEAAGTPVLIEPAMAKHTAGQVGTHFAGWFSFQPLFARISREQPDLFD